MPRPNLSQRWADPSDPEHRQRCLYPFLTAVHLVFITQSSGFSLLYDSWYFWVLSQSPLKKVPTFDPGVISPSPISAMYSVADAIITRRGNDGGLSLSEEVDRRRENGGGAPAWDQDAPRCVAGQEERTRRSKREHCWEEDAAMRVRSCVLVRTRAARGY